MKYYMHRNSLDSCFLVRSIRNVTPQYISLDVEWYNLGYSGKPWRLGLTQTVHISKDSMAHDWIEITDRLHIPRKRPGLPE